MIKNKKLINSILIFVFFTVFATLINLNNQDFSYDRIWLFHMMQKIANGELIYTEINVLVGPIFYILGGLIFKIFGANFIVYDIFGGVLYGAFSVLMYNLVKEINIHDNKILNLSLLVVISYFAKYFSLANYNLLVIIFIMSAMFIEIRKAKNKGSKYSNLLIGIFLGLAFFTKQTIAGLAVISTTLISLINGFTKKQNLVKEILQKVIGFFIVLITMVISMLAFGNLIDYIDLAFGGILEFGGNNVNFAGTTLYVVLMTAILGCSVFVCKLKKDDLEFLIITAYSFAIIFFAYPIFNMYHMHLATLFIWFLLIKLVNICIENEKTNIFKLFIVIPITLFLVSIYTGGGSSGLENIETKEIIFNLIIKIIDIALLSILGIALIKNKNDIPKKSITICSVLCIVVLIANYIIDLNENKVPEGLEIYANHGFKTEKLEEISNVIKYIESKEKEGYKVYVISWDASEYMAPMNRNNNKYDLLFNGNLGYGGKEEILKEIKNFENTLILKNKEEFWQEPKEIMEYIENNYELIDEVENLNVFIP